jgi:HEAT repeat protein
MKRVALVVCLVLLPAFAYLVRSSQSQRAGSPRRLAEVARGNTGAALQAATALATVSDRGAAAELSDIAFGTAPVLVRANAVRALGRSGSADDARALVVMVGDKSQPFRMRQEAALALGQIGSRAVVPALVSALEVLARDASGEQLRISVIQALGQLGSGEAHAFLAQYLKGPLSPAEHAFALRAYRQSS